MTTLALIVGSGFERLGFAVAARSPTKTPYGEPSSPVLTLAIGDARVACIARHGESHALAPHEINYRANVWALQQRGARSCLGINTVGAIAIGFAPGELAVPDQLIDYTHGRIATFGGGDAGVRHAEFTEPFSPTLRGRIASAAADRGHTVRAGTYGVTQGPRLETAAEIERMARDGCTMVGMTAMPEAVLARELGLEYAVCAVAVNYAAGRSPDGTPIEGQIDRYVGAGLTKVRAVLERLVADGSDAV
jgi:5'-methylthioinosine phosphorylase